jgi:hypothetical protein
MVLKRFIALVVVLTLTFIASVASAEQMSAESLMAVLNKVQGTWYDTAGNPSFTFDGGTLNGYRITGLFDPAGGSSDFGAKIQLLVNNHYQMFPVSFQGLSSNKNIYHQYMFADGQAYRRTPQERYYESVGGIYLGMTRNQVLALYGQPDVDQNSSMGYSKLGLMLDVRNSLVQQIKILAYGDRRMDRTGLSATSSVAQYANAYGMNRVPSPNGGANAIGYGEYIWFAAYPQSVTLSLFWN